MEQKGKVVLKYWRYFSLNEMECDSVRDAVASALAMSDDNQGSADSVVSVSGEVLLAGDKLRYEMFNLYKD